MQPDVASRRSIDASEPRGRGIKTTTGGKRTCFEASPEQVRPSARRRSRRPKFAMDLNNDLELAVIDGHGSHAPGLSLPLCARRESANRGGLTGNPSRGRSDWGLLPLGPSMGAANSRPAPIYGDGRANSYPRIPQEDCHSIQCESLIAVSFGHHGTESKAPAGMMADALACHYAPDPQVGETGYINQGRVAMSVKLKPAARQREA